MIQHTYNPTTDLGRYNLKGQQKPDYLLKANEIVELAWKTHAVIVDKGYSPEMKERARAFANDCQQLARDAYIRWQQSMCKHEFTRTHHIGSEYMSMGEPDDNDTGGIDVCISCHKEIG